MKVPKKLTRSRAEDFVEAVKMDKTHEELASMFDVSVRTVHNWIKSEWFALIEREGELDGLQTLIAKARVNLESMIESDNEQVSLRATLFALERLDPEFAPASAKQKVDDEKKGGIFANATDSDMEKYRKMLRGGPESVEDSSNSAPHENFAFSFGDKPSTSV